MIVRAFKKTYDDRTVLDFPGFEFEAGRVYAILGANGSGKSTFAKALAGIIAADERVKPVDGQQSIGYMPQKSYAFRMSTLKNVMLTGTDEEAARAALREMGIEQLADKSGHKLSGGETARMALARLMVKHYDVLILDEPSASMDMKSVALAEQMIKEYCERENSTVILVTHSLQQARRMADKVLFFCEGELCEAGDAKQVLDSPKEEKTKEFLEFM